MKKDLVIIAAGGHAREVHQAVEDMNAQNDNWNFLGFLDEDASKWGATLHDYPILGPQSWLTGKSGVHAVIAIGNPSVRKRIAQSPVLKDIPFASIIHPDARIGNRVQIGAGAMIFQGVCITTDVVLGQHVILNTASSISHECVLSNFATVHPGARMTGACQMGEGAELGAGAVVIPGKKLGQWCRVGAGAVVIQDVPERLTVVGVPTKPVHK